MSGRQEDLRMKSSFAGSRDRRSDMGRDPHMGSRGGDREEQSLRSRRSLSPRRALEGARRAVARDRRSSSLEARRGCEEQHIGRVRGEHGLSISPPVEHGRKRSHLDDRGFNISPTSMDSRRKYESPEYVDYNNMNSRSKYGVGHDERFESGKEDYIERRSSASGRRLLAQNPMTVDDAVDGEVQLCANYGYTSRYEDASGSYSTVDMHRIRDDNPRYQADISHEKISKDVYYKGGEKYAYHASGSPYLESPVSQRKGFELDDFHKRVPGTSSGMTSRGAYSSKVRDVRSVLSDGYPKSFIRGIEPPISDDYDQRTVLDPRRRYEPGIRETKCSCDAYASTGTENYPEIGLRVIDEPTYHRDNTSARAEHKEDYPQIKFRVTDDPSYRREDFHEKLTYGNNEHDRSLIGPDIVDTTVENMCKVEDPHFSRRINKNNGVREPQKEMVQGYVDMRRSTNALKQTEECFDYGHADVELAEKFSNHPYTSEFGGCREHEIENPRSGHSYGRYATARSDERRMKNLNEFRNDMDIHRVVGSERTKAEEPVVYERALKRKYIDEVDIDSKSFVPRKSYSARKTRDFDDYQVGVIARRSNIGHPNRSSRYEQNYYYIEPEQMSEEIHRHKSSADLGWTSYQNQSESIQEESGKPFRTGSRYFRGYSKYESSKSHSYLHHSLQRSNHYKQHIFRQRNEDDNNLEMLAQDIDLPEDTTDIWKSGPPEEPERFKQRVQAAFLDFSKRVNENPTARRLYKEQGKAGSLFCIVCRRSGSKEFQDTRALASHAFMSRKVGLRAQHLGLHKAICVLMGWNIKLDHDSGTWIPEALPQAEALALKEDLILWPPLLVIHNISLSSNDHNEWKLINIESLGEFLRAKGFSLGKMKICLGNPGDHSVILVKFLNTFSGLQEAERLHKYFSDNRHGRIDFEQAISSIGNIDNLGQGSIQIDQLEDTLLYGYMGISDDMDKVDFDTKKKCSVKSKKEIHDLADAPVKSDLAR